jgi:hypothetical protein
MTLSTPVTFMLLMRAALHRDPANAGGQNGQEERQDE